MAESRLLAVQEIRVHALREANYFAANYNIARDKSVPLLKASEVLTVGRLFEVYLADGTVPEVDAKAT